MKEFKKALRALLLALLAYLVQACVMEYLTVSGVTGSVLFAVLAIITVSYGKKFAFCASCIIGMCMESMLSQVQALYVVAYPVITMICAQFFADMSDRQRERRRMLRQGRGHGGREGDLPALLRIPLCAGLMDLLLNIVLCAYMYLIGVELSFLHAARALISLIYTIGLAAALMIPARYYLGMYPKRRPQRAQGGDKA